MTSQSSMGRFTISYYMEVTTTSCY